MFDLDRFVEDCRVALLEALPQRAVGELLQSTLSKYGEVVAALGEPSEAGIQTLYRSPELTILNVVWAPGMSLYPHDHRMWAAIGIYGGREDNYFFRRAATGLESAGNRDLETAGTLLLGKDAIHAITNPLGTYTGGLHVYGGDFFGVPRSEWDPDTLEERPWDIERARRLFREANERAQTAAGETGARE